MILAWPRDLDGRAWRHGAQPLTVAILLLALAARLLVTWPWAAGSTLDALADGVAWLALYSDPGQGLFRPWQPWTASLAHPGWGSLASAGLAWWIFAGACERRLGSLLFGVLIVIATPAWTTVPVLLGTDSLQPGLLPVSVACAAGLLAIQPRARVRGRYAFWFGRWAGLGPWQLPAALVLVVLVAASLLTLGLFSPRAGDLEIWAVLGAGLLASAVAGQIILLSLIGIRTAMVLRPLIALAQGTGRLDAVPARLAVVDDLPEPVVSALAERALREDHRPAIAACAEHLRRTAPDAPILTRLEARIVDVARP